MLEFWKRLFGVGTRVRPITAQDVDPAPRDPEIEDATKQAKRELFHELVKIEHQSREVRRLLAQDALELVVRPPGKKR